MYKHKAPSNMLIRIIAVRAIAYLSLFSVSSLLLAEDLPAGEKTATIDASEQIQSKTASNSAEVKDGKDVKVPKTKNVPVLAAPKSATRDTTDVFRPSEEISEDFAAPFPVDI